MVRNGPVFSAHRFGRFCTLGPNPNRPEPMPSPRHHISNNHCRLKTHSRSCILIHEIQLQKGFPYLSLELNWHSHLSLSSYFFSPFSYFHPFFINIYITKKSFFYFDELKSPFIYVEKLHIFFILSLIHIIPIHILLHSNYSTNKSKRKFTGSFLFLCNCFFHYN
jgi:hypothetical protein